VANITGNSAFQRNFEKGRLIVTKTVTKNNHRTGKAKNRQRKTRQNAAVARARQVMKLGHSRDEKLYKAELAKLLDEFGVDFVCHHACQEAAHGRKACPEGHCAKPYEHTGAEDCTCAEMLFSYINDFVGYRSDEDAKAAAASTYAVVPAKNCD
jgi:hypothetical protein